MVFCNLPKRFPMLQVLGHNPYFNRWFSAILIKLEKAWERLKSQSLF